MNDIVTILYGSNDAKHWTHVARLKRLSDSPYPPPSAFNSPFRYHKYEDQPWDQPLPNGLPEKKPLDGTWGWR